MYVDDAIAGAHKIADAIKARKELLTALKFAGFDIRKWASNSKSVIADIPADLLLNEDFLEFEDSSTGKTAGIRWNALSDNFLFNFTLNDCTNSREVLSQISKLFDPAGWLSPYIVVVKIIMQQIWIG